MDFTRQIDNATASTALLIIIIIVIIIIIAEATNNITLLHSPVALIESLGAYNWCSIPRLKATALICVGLPGSLLNVNSILIVYFVTT